MIMKIFRKFKPNKRSVIERSILEGAKSFCDKKETIIIALDESSLTKESILSLSLGELLNDKYNIIHYVAKKSQNHKLFLKSCYLLIEADDYEGEMLHIGTVIDYLNKEYKVKSVICNSLFTMPVLESANYVGVPTLFIFNDQIRKDNENLNTELFNLVLFADSIIFSTVEMSNDCINKFKKLASTQSFPKNLIVNKPPIDLLSPNSISEDKTQSKEIESYISFLNQQIAICHSNNRENRIIANAIHDAGVVNFDYMGNKFSSEIEAIYKHVMLYRKDIPVVGAKNPKPGFSNLKWQMENEKSHFVPIYDAINKQVLTTHDCHIISNDIVNDETTYNGRVAVHLHLYYVDLAEEFASYFKNISAGYDLYVTNILENNDEYIKRVFADCGADKVEVVTVPNVGRDVGPMIFDLKDKLCRGGYDVLGHFHSKKSVGNDKVSGDGWRKYLLDNLVGRHVNQILGLFNNKRIGLVFTDDSTAVDIGENYKYISNLCEWFGLSNIEQTPVFPVGNMFWSRVDAIKGIFELDKDVILQQEPLPYDGSYLHALERLLLYVVEKNGYEYTTIYKEGTSH